MNGGHPHAVAITNPQLPLRATTRICAVYGHPIRHSASPAMHNAAFCELGLDWRYTAFDVPPAELASALQGARAMRFIGVNLTVPHKLLAATLVDVIDPDAATWGAVNTIRFEGQVQGEWQPLAKLDQGFEGPTRSHGFNTDAVALIRALREDLGVEPAATRVLLLGAGGAGRVAALMLAGSGVKELWLVNRSEDKAISLITEIQRRFPGVDVHSGYPAHPIELALNATSLGLKPTDPLPIDPAWAALHRPSSAYDMIYQPAETPFLRLFRSQGAQTANGLGMLLHQGAAAQELWTGVPAPVERMREAIRLHMESICP